MLTYTAHTLVFIYISDSKGSLISLGIWHLMTIKGGTNKACAACKYQRRKCSKQCPLSPYFPADQPKKFSNAHRLFGVSNIMRILKQVEPKHRDEAMKSIIFESDMRAQYPVMGCLGVIWNYDAMIRSATEELHCLKRMLAIYKQNFPPQHYLPPPISPPMPNSNDNLQNNNIISHLGVFDENKVYGNTYIESIQEEPNRQKLSIAADYNNSAMIDDRQSITECREASDSRYIARVFIFI